MFKYAVFRYCGLSRIHLRKQFAILIAQVLPFLQHFKLYIRNIDNML